MAESQTHTMSFLARGLPHDGPVRGTTLRRIGS
jgi:hypothetical protein